MSFLRPSRGGSQSARGGPSAPQTVVSVNGTDLLAYAGIVISSPTLNQTLKYDGTHFVNVTSSGGGIVEANLQSDYNAVGDGVTDDTVAVQNWVNACSSNTGFGTPTGYAPAGSYKITSTINFPNTFCTLRGDGPNNTQFLCDGVTGGVFKPAAITYFKPDWTDFAIIGDATTGIGIDFSAVTSQVYGGTLNHIRLNTGGDCIYAPLFFSMRLEHVFAGSINGHAFRIACGPGVSFDTCYALSCGTGKAGYRLTGSISLHSCNGLDGGDWWGVFGQDTAASDGFENDFPTLGHDYPSITLISCNIEHFTKGGLMIHQSHRHAQMINGKIDRNALSSAYDSLIKIKKSPVVTGNPLRVAIGPVLTGSGVPNGGGALTNAYIHVIPSGAYVLDETGSLASALPGYYSDAHAGLLPILRKGVTQDTYQDSAETVTALMPRRLTVQTIRYDTTTLTPVGSAQAIDVTGYSKVVVTPVSAASVSTCTFTQSIGTGAGTDWLRNGNLLIEAGNANLTINHTASGANTFRLINGTNKTLASGEIMSFCWSTTSTQWIELGPVTGLVDGDKGDITVSSSGTVWNIDSGVVTTTELGGDITVAGKALLDDADASAQRTTLGLGTLATQSGTFSGTSSGTNTGDQTSIVGITGTVAQFNTAITDGDLATGGGTATGTNTGDQTITLTGNVTGSGTGSFAATIANSAVTLAKMADVATATVFYRKTAATGVPEVQTLATLKTDLGLTGTNSGDQTITLTSDVTGSGTGSFATTIAADAVTNTKLANMATATFKGRTTAGTGDPEDLTATQATALLNSFTGDAGAGGLKGLVPAPVTGDATKFLKGDGTWTTLAGGGDALVSNPLSQFAATTSAQLAGVISDEQGSGALVFATAPTLTRPVLAAGDASNPAITLTSQTLMTTPTAGVIEMDANCFYGTTDAGNRGVSLIEHYVAVPVGNRTLTSSTAEQAIFAAANDTLTLETGLYFFEMLISMDTMSATSGNAAFDLLGAGTATITRLHRHYGVDGLTNAVAAGSGSADTAQTLPSMVTAGTGTGLQFMMMGAFRVTAAGTIIPSLSLVTAAAAIVRDNSFFRCRRMGSSTAEAVGQWS